MNDAGELLFCYGTLREPEVQRALFGRTFAAEPDALRGHKLMKVAIGGTCYWSLAATGRPADRVEGLVLRLGEAELEATDAYEGGTDYVRVRIRLESGREAFVYLSAAG